MIGLIYLAIIGDVARALLCLQGLQALLGATDPEGLARLLETELPLLGTPLAAACLNGRVTMMRLLISFGASTRWRRPGDGETLLRLAVASGSAAAVRALLDAGADADGANRLGETALFRAAQLGHVGAAEALLEAGADLDARNWAGVTPLCEAVVRGHPGTFWYLRRAGARTEVLRRLFVVYNHNRSISAGYVVPRSRAAEPSSKHSEATKSSSKSYKFAESDSDSSQSSESSKSSKFAESDSDSCQCSKVAEPISKSSKGSKSSKVPKPEGALMGEIHRFKRLNLS